MTNDKKRKKKKKSDTFFLQKRTHNYELKDTHYFQLN